MRRLERPTLARRARSLARIGLCLIAAACTAPEPPPANVILISIDTLRADHLGCYGHPRPTSPTLDRLAEEGVLFEDASSTAPWTLPAHGSLLTGRYPSRHGMTSVENRLAQGVVTLAELLRDRGFDTAAIVNSHYLDRRYGLDRGFSEFEYVVEEIGQSRPSGVERAATAWLKRRGERRFFLFLHYYDVHSDYRSLPRYQELMVRPSDSRADGTTAQLLRYRAGEVALDEDDAEHLRDLYDAGIRQLDDGLGRLLAVLELQGLLEETVVVVTSDHGEEFLEHGGVLHGRTQFQELIRIPLIVRGPGIPKGVVIREPVSLLDVMPTLLALSDVPPPPDLDGVDLRPLWSGPGGRASPRVLFSEADHNNEQHNVKRAARQQRFKLHRDLQTGASALFDLVDDPGEQRNVLSERPDVAALLAERLQRFIEGDVAGESGAPLSPEEIERLKRLGYMQ